MGNEKRNVDAAAWLAVLLEARQKGDLETAGRAERELARIGVKVRLEQDAQAVHRD